MSESKKGVHQISPNSFLFFNTPEIMYYISLETYQKTKIKITIIKIMENSTNIYDSIIEYSVLGTGDTSPQDTIKNIDFIIYNYNFIIKEEKEKINILFNTKNPCNIDLSLHKFESENDNEFDINYNKQIKNIENKIKELMDIAEMQEQEIYQLKQKENINMNKMQNLNQQAEQLLFKLDEQNRNNQNNNNQFNGVNNNYQYNNNQNNNNYNQNNQNNNYGNNPYSQNNNMNLHSNNGNLQGNNININGNNKMYINSMKDANSNIIIIIMVEIRQMDIILMNKKSQIKFNILILY